MLPLLPLLRLLLPVVAVVAFVVVTLVVAVADNCIASKAATAGFAKLSFVCLLINGL